MRFRNLDDYYAWIRSLPILENAGRHPPADDRCVRSWEGAEAMCDDDESVNYFITFGNELRMAIIPVDSQAVTRRWNEQGKEIMRHADIFRDAWLLPRDPQLARFPHLLNRLVNHTVIAAQELMFSDLVQRDEAMQLVEYFQTGHMIVGYRGEFPDGYRITF